MNMISLKSLLKFMELTPYYLLGSHDLISASLMTHSFSQYAFETSLYEMAISQMYIQIKY